MFYFEIGTWAIIESLQRVMRGEEVLLNIRKNPVLLLKGQLVPKKEQLDLVLRKCRASKR